MSFQEMKQIYQITFLIRALRLNIHTDYQVCWVALPKKKSSLRS